jgi:hypothetical protein
VTAAPALAAALRSAAAVPVDAALSVALRYCGAALSASAGQLALLLGPGLLLAALMHALSGFVERRASRSLGGAAYLLFGWLGTIVHETGHAVFCLLFGHRITGVKWFDFAPRDGTRGHVSHTFDPANPWQQVGNFFIGIGPVLFGTAVIVAAARWLLGAEALARMMEPLPGGGLVRSAGDGLALARHVAGGAGGALAALLQPHRLLDWRVWVFLYLTFAVGSAISLSRADLEGALAGFGSLVLLVVLANLATLWLGDVLGPGVAWLSRWQAVGYAAMLFALLLNALAALAVLAIPGPAAR